MKRYIIVKGSHSAHCCFDYSIMDTSQGKSEYSPDRWAYCVCECFYEEDAELICNKLNYDTLNK